MFRQIWSTRKKVTIGAAAMVIGLVMMLILPASSFGAEDRPTLTFAACGAMRLLL